MATQCNKAVWKSVVSKGQLINAKSIKIGQLLERIEKMEEVENLLLDRLNIRNSLDKKHRHAPIAQNWITSS